MPEQRVTIGQRGWKSFQAGYDAGYAQCKLDIANEPPSTEEMKWLRKLRYGIALGTVEFHVNYVAPENQSAMDEFAKRNAADYAELQTSRYIKSLQEEIDRLRESPRPDWTPCAEGCEYCEGGKALVIGETNDYGIAIKFPKKIIAYGYDIHGAGSNGLVAEIQFCPKCGKQLPEPYRADQKEDAE